MKRLFSALVILTLGALAFASVNVTFSGRYALIGENGRTIRRTTKDIEESGVFLATGDEKAKATSDDFTVILGEDSLLALKGSDEKIAYLVYGYMTVLSEGKTPLTVYTPTTMADISGRGEYFFISTDTEEKVYSFSSPLITLYDGIRRKTIELPYNEGYDYLKGKSCPVDESMRYLEVPMNTASPVFAPVVSYLTGKPDAPEISSVIQKMTGKPDAPSFSQVEIIDTSSPDAPSINSVVSVLVEDNEDN